MENLGGFSHQLAVSTHPLIKHMRLERMSRESVSVVLGQWYHPLHYFPEFLARHIAVAPDIASKTYASKILWQELGEGDPARAHETIFIDTMAAAGFTRGELVEAVPLGKTRELLDQFAACGKNLSHSLGALFATEAADLTMVAAIGASVRHSTGLTALPWVEIHVRQEPDHTESVEKTIFLEHDAIFNDEVEVATNSMAKRWWNFFSGIQAEIGFAL